MHSNIYCKHDKNSVPDKYKCGLQVSDISLSVEIDLNFFKDTTNLIM